MLTQGNGGDAPKRRFPASSHHYSVHPSIEHLQQLRLNLPSETGRSLAEWVRLVRKEGPEGAAERVAWLRHEHKLGKATAALVLDAVDGRAEADNDHKAYLRAAPEYVEAMYGGARAGLRPIHDRLIQVSRALGSDVRVCPGKQSVPLFRAALFAEIKPVSRQRIELSLALKGASRDLIRPPLAQIGGATRVARLTHRLAFDALDQVDQQVRDWLRAAYELSR